MRYEVIRAFRDKLDNRRRYDPGDVYTPPTEERARQLVSLGFIRPVEVEAPPVLGDPRPKAVPPPERNQSRSRKTRHGRGAEGAGGAE